MPLPSGAVDFLPPPEPSLRRLFLALRLTEVARSVISYRPLPGGAVLQPTEQEKGGSICTYINTCCPGCGEPLWVVVVRFLTGRLEACRVGFERIDSAITAERAAAKAARTVTYAEDGSLVDPSISGAPVRKHLTAGVTVGPSGKLSSRFMKTGAQAPERNKRR